MRRSSMSLGTADLSGVQLDAVDGDHIAHVVARALASCLGTIAWQVHRFEPRGASLVGVAACGRVIVHTWPERAALTIDLYAAPAQVDAALAAAVQALMPTERVARGTAASDAGSRRRPA